MITKQLLVLNKTIVLITLIAYLGLITFLSLVSIDNNTNIKVEYGDKIVHSIIHAINVILFYLVFVKYNFVRPILLAVVASIFYGIIIEVLQEQFTTVRTFDVFDIYANCLGTLVTAVFLKIKGKAIVKKI